MLVQTGSRVQIFQVLRVPELDFYVKRHKHVPRRLVGDRLLYEGDILVPLLCPVSCVHRFSRNLGYP